MSAVLQFTLKAKDEASRVVSATTDHIEGKVKGLDSTVGKLAQSFGFSEGKAAALGKTLPVVGAAAGAVGAAVAGLGAAIFALTKSASDAGSEIFEAGQKSNLSAEFLSVLKVQAEQSGSSFEGATAKVVKWGNSLVDAARGNKELTADLKRFGIDAAEAYRNPEAALKTFIERFNQLPPSAANNEAAMRLFKDRSGELIPVLRAFGGDYDELVRKLDASGQIWTREATEKADEFGDALTELQQTASGVGNTFAREVMPDITGAMKEGSRFVTENKATFREWGRAVGDVVRGVRAVVESEVGAVIKLLARLAPVMNPVIGIAEALRQIGVMSGSPAAAVDAEKFGPIGPRGVATPATGQPPPAAPPDVVNEVAAKEAARKREQARKEEQRRIEEAHKENVRFWERATANVNALTEKNRREMEEAQEDAANRERELANERIKASEDVQAAIREELAILTDENRHLTEINNTIRRAEILGAIDARTSAWLRQLAVLNDIADKINEVAPPEGLTTDIPYGKGQEKGPYVDPYEHLREQGPPPPPNFDLWHEALKGLKGAAKDAFGGITAGFGSMIYSFLMGEKMAGKSFAAIAKAAVASVAAEAGVRALFEIGMFLATFWRNPAEAAMHLASAKTFGMVAAVAGAAALALPGGGAGAGAYGNETGAAFGGGGGGGFNRDSGPRVLEQSRTQVIEHVHILRVESNDSHIVEVLDRDARTNGKTRSLIIEMAAA